MKTDFNNRGKDLGGIIWEEDPVLHREVAKKVSPAFSSRSIRAMEPLIHEYMDFFIEKMKQLGKDPKGVDLVEWTNWLALDISADLSWNEKFHEMRDSELLPSCSLISDAESSGLIVKNSIHLDVILGFNFFVTVMQVFKRFPLLGPFQYFLAPFGSLRSFTIMEESTRLAVRQRIDKKGKTEHVDFFEYLIPADSPVSLDKRELLRFGSVGVQIMFAGFGPMSDWFYGTLFFLLEEAECYKILTAEIRNSIKSYSDITPSSLKSLPYLQACLEESLRLFQSNDTGMPRVSPGAMVDGQYIPRGVRSLLYQDSLLQTPVSLRK